MLSKSSACLREAEEILALTNTIFSLEERRVDGKTGHAAHGNFPFHQWGAVVLVSAAHGGRAEVFTFLFPGDADADGPKTHSEDHCSRPK